MHKVLLSTFGIMSALLIAAAIGFSVLSSYRQVEQDGRALGIATAVTPTAILLPTALPTEVPTLNQTVVIAQGEGLQNETLERKTVTIFKRKDLQKIWATIYGSTAAAPPLPVIDFTKNAVIVVLAGKQPSGGYKVTYTGLEDTTEYTMIQFDETLPGNDCRTTDVMTSPFIAVQVPNSGKTFKTVFNSKQSVCK